MKMRPLFLLVFFPVQLPAGLWWDPEPPGIGYSFTVAASGEESGDYVYLVVYKNGSCIAQSQGYDSAWAGANVVADGTTYFLAEKTASNNPDQETIDATVNATTYPQPFAPDGLQVGSITPASFDLTWQPAVFHLPIAGYEVRRNGISLGGGSLTSMAITGLTPGETYQVEVRASGNGSWSGWSTSYYITLVDTTPPSAPGSLQSPVQSAVAVNLTWAASNDPNGMITYDIYLNSGGVGQYVGSTAMNVTTFVHPQFPGGSYTYTVRARDTFGNASAASNAVTVSTPASGDTDTDGIPNQLEALFGNLNPTTPSDGAINLKIHRPH